MGSMNALLGTVVGLLAGAAFLRVMTSLEALALVMLATAVALVALWRPFCDATRSMPWARRVLWVTAAVGALAELTVMMDGLSHESCTSIMTVPGESQSGGWITLPCLSVLLVLPPLVLLALLGQMAANLVRRPPSP